MSVISHDVRSGSKPDRNLALELVRVTEAAALASARWVGRGDKEAADQAAVDAMRLLLDTVPMDGVVVIGEGEKDEAPMLYNGEPIGDGSPPEVDIAVDPLEGTRLTAHGQRSALSVIALSERGTMFDPGPCVYMEKIAGGPRIADCLSLTDPLPDVIRRVAERKGTDPGDVTIIMLDRPRHEDGVKQIREAGARIRFITDGDVSAALFAVSQDTGIDMLWGIGGTPEGVLSAAAIKCLGGQILGRLWPRDDEELEAQRVDHRSGEQGEAERVEPDQRDDDEADRPADLPDRGHVDQIEGECPVGDPDHRGEEQRPRPHRSPRDASLRHGPVDDARDREAEHEGRGEEQQVVDDPDVGEPERQVVGAGDERALERREDDAGGEEQHDHRQHQQG